MKFSKTTPIGVLSKKIGVPSKKKKNITSSQPRKLIFGIQPYLTHLDEICKNNTDWGAIKKTDKIGLPYKLFLGSIKKIKSKLK
jgi:hypothetical protein